MASLAEMAAAKGKTIGNNALTSVKVQQIHYTKLHPSEKNFYEQTEIEEMADSIALAGIIQPLIVRKTDIGEYEVIVGHRRRLGVIRNVERGLKECEFLPCIEVRASDKMVQEIKNLSNLTDREAEEIYVRYILIASNSINRERSDYERMMEAMELKAIIPYMSGNAELKGRALRVEIAKEMKRSTGLIGTYESIYNNLISEGMERFKRKEIGISVAAGLAGLPADMQKRLISKQDLYITDIEQAKASLVQNVSESDTVENAQPPIFTESEGDFGEMENENEPEKEENPVEVGEPEDEWDENEEVCSHFPKCYLCGISECNSRQEERTTCLYDQEKPCNIHNAIKLMYKTEPELEENCPGCCARCENKNICGYACHNSKELDRREAEQNRQQSAHETAMAAGLATAAAGQQVQPTTELKYKVTVCRESGTEFVYANGADVAAYEAKKFLERYKGKVKQVTINIVDM